MAVTASNFKQFSDYYHKVTNPDDSIEVQYYVWEADYLQDSITDGSQYNATWSFRNTVAMMELYAGIFGEYPFKKYGMVAIQPFVFGGMEHQTITSINRSWLRGWYEGGIAHELVHQWLGDQVTCATWNDIWINEGGATFGQALWTEYIAGRPAYDQEMAFNRWYYVRRSDFFDVPIYGINVDYIFWTHSVLVYQKASWVYHMLREMLGEEAYFSVLRKILIDNKFTSIETLDFENAFKESITNPKIPFDIYFKQWIYGGGHPLYDINSNVHVDQSNNYSADITLKQRQDGSTVAEVFHAPVMLRFFDETGALIHSQEVINTQREQTFNISLPSFPDSVAIDQTLLLCEVFDNIVSVKEETEPGNISNEVYPNPLHAGETGKIGLVLSLDSRVNAEIYDLNGARLAEVYEGFLSQSTYSLSFATAGLARGVYILKISDNGSFLIKKFTVAE
jgi:aminopeptidase N